MTARAWLRRLGAWAVPGVSLAGVAVAPDGRAEPAPASTTESPGAEALPGPEPVERAPGPPPEPDIFEEPVRPTPRAPPEPTVAPLPPMARLELQPLDYNAPAPQRTGYHWGRALAAVATANYLVWQINWVMGEDWAYVTRDDLQRNLRRGFTFDGNKLPTNYLSHPMHGASYFSVGRASGLNFWESSSMAFLGSLSWELVGETEQPSTNDLLVTTLGGIALGEILYRLSSEVLDDGSTGLERVLREVFAGLINPGRGIERLVDGKAWRPGPSATRRHVVHTAVDVGVDRIRLLHDESVEPYPARPLLALQIQYGDWLPDDPEGALEPYEAFDFYTALNLGRLPETGAQIYAQGILWGVSSDVGRESGPYRDNNVVGLVQSFDFRGARVAQFGGMGLGPGTTLVVRYGPERSLRFGADLQWLVLGASSSPLDGERSTGYNFFTGITTTQELRLDMAAAGEVGFRSKQYSGVVVDGEDGEEFIGHTRLWYELDVIGRVGVGLSPNVVHRISRFDSVGRIARAQLETQLYVRGHF